MTTPLTRGIHHLGLAVPDLDTARQFFVDALGWAVVGDDPAYPAAFVSDGQIMLTLWRVADPAHAAAFDRKANVGLHHLALAVPDEAALATLFKKLHGWPGVVIEREPSFIRGDAGARHFFCAMPGAYASNSPRHWPEEGQTINGTKTANIAAVRGAYAARRNPP